MFLNIKGKAAFTFKCSFFILILGIAAANAQPATYQPFSIGVGYGVTTAFAGEQTATSSNAANLNLTCHFTPFTAISLEGQFGTLSGGDALHDNFAKQFVNSYSAIIIHFDMQMGELIDYSHSEFLNGLKNLYGGIGFGFLSNKITAIQTVNPLNASTPLTYLPQSNNMLIPVRLGYEFKIFNRHDEPQFRFDIAYSFNTALGQGLDGYTSSKSASVKFYNYIAIGLKYGFGDVHGYYKKVSYSHF